VTTHIPQKTVYKSRHVFPANGPCLHDCLIDSSGFRDAVHEQDLVNGNTEDVKDGRLDIPERKAHCLLNSPVKSKSPSKNSLNQVDNKGTISLRQMRMLPQGTFQVSLHPAWAIIKPVERF